jgi:hypothetical protein
MVSGAAPPEQWSKVIAKRDQDGVLAYFRLEHLSKNLQGKILFNPSGKSQNPQAEGDLALFPIPHRLAFQNLRGRRPGMLMGKRPTGYEAA